MGLFVAVMLVLGAIGFVGWMISDEMERVQKVRFARYNNWWNELEDRAMHRARKRAERFRAEGYSVTDDEVHVLAEVLLFNMKERGCPYA